MATAAQVEGMEEESQRIEEVGNCKCKIIDDKGNVCNATCHDRKALLRHMRAHHHVRNLPAVLTPCNICIRCRQIFSTTVTARRRLLGSVLRGNWSTRGPTSLEALVPPATYDCPVCEHKCAD
eukprot:7614733-Pyramimonas_sp.AAC.1